MKEFLFVLGRDDDLSYLELLSYLDSRTIPYSHLERKHMVVFLQLDDSFDYTQAIKDLGGVVKIAGSYYKGNTYSKFDPLIFMVGRSFLYTVTGYGVDVTNFSTYLKSYFKREGVKALYKPRGFTPKRFKEETVEFILFKDFVFKVEAVFDPKEYKWRDLHRPHNDFLRNISIRLAKIMINLSGAKKGCTLVDPFCGVGVILGEAGLMGCNVIGLDKDARMVEASYTNLKWLAQQSPFTYKIIKGDASSLYTYVRSVDVIVTEPDLGPYWRKIPKEHEALATVHYLETLYTSFLRSARKVLKQNGKIVMIVPILKTEGTKKIRINFESILSSTGFNVVTISNEVRIPYFYKKKGSKIDREIWVIH